MACLLSLSYVRRSLLLIESRRSTRRNQLQGETDGDAKNAHDRERRGGRRGQEPWSKLVKTIPQLGGQPLERVLYDYSEPPYTWSEYTIVDFGSAVFTDLTTFAYDNILVWDQPNGQGNMFGFTGFGWADLAAYGWAERVRSYRGGNIQGSFVGGNPVRHEEFGLNSNIVNAGPMLRSQPASISAGTRSALQWSSRGRFSAR
jgi:hypothetical protein